MLVDIPTYLSRKIEIKLKKKLRSKEEKSIKQK
jgi:hypothetical protein